MGEWLGSEINRSYKIWVLVYRGKECERRMKRVVELEVMVEGQYYVCVKAQQREKKSFNFPHLFEILVIIRLSFILSFELVLRCLK